MRSLLRPAALLILLALLLPGKVGADDAARPLAGTFTVAPATHAAIWIDAPAATWTPPSLPAGVPYYGEWAAWLRVDIEAAHDEAFGFMVFVEGEDGLEPLVHAVSHGYGQEFTSVRAESPRDLRWLLVVANPSPEGAASISYWVQPIGAHVTRPTTPHAAGPGGEVAYYYGDAWTPKLPYPANRLFASTYSQGFASQGGPDSVRLEAAHTGAGPGMHAATFVMGASHPATYAVEWTRDGSTQEGMGAIVGTPAFGFSAAPEAVGTATTDASIAVTLTPAARAHVYAHSIFVPLDVASLGTELPSRFRPFV